MSVGLRDLLDAQYEQAIIDSEDATLSKDLQVWICAAITAYRNMPDADATIDIPRPWRNRATCSRAHVIHFAGIFDHLGIHAGGLPSKLFNRAGIEINRTIVKVLGAECLFTRSALIRRSLSRYPTACWLAAFHATRRSPMQDNDKHILPPSTWASFISSY
jgi:hypothetical protein